MNNQLSVASPKLKTVCVLFACVPFALSTWAGDQPQWALAFPVESVFPSLAISTATIDRSKLANKDATYIGDPIGMIGLEVVSPKKNCPIAIEISSQKFIQKTVWQGVLPDTGVKYHIFPAIAYNYDALGKIIEPTPEMITATVTIDGQNAGAQNKTIAIRSVHDCLHTISTERGKLTDFSWLFAAYVNENSPLVEQILKEALRLKLVDSFSGYQGGEQEVKNQAFAIWNVLQRQGVKYSSITTPSIESESQHIFTQSVRSLEDSLSGKQANCVDGSVLFASIYRKIGLQPFLVLIPGHCFVGIKLDQAGKKGMCIETTLIGGVDLKKLSIERGIESLNSGRKNNLSWTSFESATAYADKEVESNKACFDKKTGYCIIDIEKARKAGILPIFSHNVE